MRSGSPPIFRIASARRHPVPDLVHVRRLHVAGDDAAAGEAAAERHAFFGRPDHHLQRMARAHVGGSQRLERAERGERAEVAVEVAAVRHRVDVRTEEDGRQGRVGAGAASEDVAGRIDAGLETGRPHQVDDVPAAGDIGVRVGDAADAVGERAARRPAEHAERLDPLSQRRRIDSSRQVLRKSRVGRGRQDPSRPPRDSSRTRAWTNSARVAPQ